MVTGYAAKEKGGRLEPFTYELPPLGTEEVDINVSFCGICHSDLSMLNNDWGMTQYPFVPGHEVVGTIAAIGSAVKNLRVGQVVGLGWFSRSCMHCEWCVGGDHNLCGSTEGTIVGRPGGFADFVRAHQGWVIPLPPGIDIATAGPLFCGGITVFNPIIQCKIQPTDRVGVIGIGGLGHIALRFLDAWGCEVTAFSSNPDKEAEAKAMGADRFINSRDPQALQEITNSLDVILSTVNVDLDWGAYLAALRPKGRLHFVGVVPSPISSPIFPMIVGQKSLSASPLGSPATIAKMLDFVARHQITPIVEIFPFERVNEALDHLKSGNARYRIVLQRN